MVKDTFKEQDRVDTFLYSLLTWDDININQRDYFQEILIKVKEIGLKKERKNITVNGINSILINHV